MSNKLVRPFPSRLELPNDVATGSLTLYASGRVKIDFPKTHPRELCKLLAGIQFDLLYGSFDMTQSSPLIKPEVPDGTPNEEQEKTES
jgi:hypothetical protein